MDESSNSVPTSSRASSRTHECEYKFRYAKAVSELSKAKQEIREQASCIRELQALLTEKHTPRSSSSKYLPLASQYKLPPYLTSSSTSTSSSHRSSDDSSSLPAPSASSVFPYPRSSSTSVAHGGVTRHTSYGTSTLPSLSQTERKEEAESKKAERVSIKEGSGSSRHRSSEHTFSSLSRSLVTVTDSPTAKTTVRRHGDPSVSSSEHRSKREKSHSSSRPSASIPTEKKTTPSLASSLLASATRVDESIARHLEGENNSNVLGLDDESYAMILQEIEDERAVRQSKKYLREAMENFNDAVLSDEDNLLFMNFLQSSSEDESFGFHPSINVSRGEGGIEMSYESLIQLEDVPTGLSAELIACLPRQSFKANSAHTSCTICLSEYDVGEEVTTLSCAHQFHFPCLSRWLACKKTCPICKEGI